MSEDGLAASSEVFLSMNSYWMAAKEGKAINASASVTSSLFINNLSSERSIRANGAIAQTSRHCSGRLRRSEIIIARSLVGVPTYVQSTSVFRRPQCISPRHDGRRAGRAPGDARAGHQEGAGAAEEDRHAAGGFPPGERAGADGEAGSLQRHVHLLPPEQCA